MKHPQKLGQMIFAAVFFCSVIGYGALNLWYAKEPLAENVQEAWDNIREEPAAETGDLAATCSKLAVMKKGNILYSGDMKEMLSTADEMCIRDRL